MNFSKDVERHAVEQELFHNPAEEIIEEEYDDDGECECESEDQYEEIGVHELLEAVDENMDTVVCVRGVVDRPRRKNSSFLFFNLIENENGIQVVIKKDDLGDEKFAEECHGIRHGDVVSVEGVFGRRNSDAIGFYEYEVNAFHVSKA